MEAKAEDLFSKGLTLEYEYDFGDTTKLNIVVVDEFPIKATQDIVLCSRNEPPEILCSVCGKAPATTLCTVCLYSGNAVFCEKCAKKHAKECADFADYANLPVVNSPRTGVCAYNGGVIDEERDGVYKM
jgi:hypothetical protein